MLVDAILLIQDVQLLCFTVVFGVLAAQRWSDRTRRWLWYTFVANAIGAAIDLLGARLPVWLTHGVGPEMIPLSYAVFNVALVCFDRRPRTASIISALILVAGFPFLLAWSGAPLQVRSNALGDLLIALESIVTIVLLLGHHERYTKAPRLLMAGFFVIFAGVEFARPWVAFVMGGDPDVTTPRLAMACSIIYVVNVSLLPLGFIWMMQARSEWDLMQQSIIDPLTAVLNRRGLEQALERELARYRRYHQELTLAILDLDHFKSVNDRYGHPAGDAILRGLADFLRKRLRRTDVLGRLGGEEFVLLFPYTDIGRSASLMEELCNNLRTCPDLLPGTDVCITASFGVTSTRERQELDGGDLLREADVALYEAKQNGRDRVCYFKAPGWIGRDVLTRSEDSSEPGSIINR
ncbi:diguanylate cyclase (GGDEF) domain-containing protein [Bryocella elongata]|uniref:diguanylate cyclase n=1 Tax=Bryocella elongata TaxID=863522 RepID=A0A1H6B3J6_9BACT|nr:GGDEF domain-containing protein [Bryocella elongata]SEG55411.1 diguanylate cyclase (GGDEF) domain-containing protein [Bryocella elongata]